MRFTKKAKQRLISLIAATSLSLTCFCMMGLAADDVYIDCSKSLAESGAYSLGTIDEHKDYDPDNPEDNTLTLEKFKAMLGAEENLGHTVICTLDDVTPFAPVNEDKSTWINTINLQYGENGEKNLAVTQSVYKGENAKSPYRFEGINISAPGVNGNKGTGYTSSGGNHLNMPYDSTSESGKWYKYSFSPGISENSLEVIKALGVSALGKNAGVKIVVRFKNITDGEAAGSSELTCREFKSSIANTFYSNFSGFVAPDGCYIAELEFQAYNKTMYMDDLCLITQEVSSEMATVSAVEITAPDTVGTPCYGTTLEYDYSVKVFDQFNRVLDKEIDVTVDNEDVASLTADGRLIIKQQTQMPATITLTASADGVTKTKDITVDTSVSPYYDASKIGVDSYVAYDEEKYGEYTEKTDYTLEEFTAAMEAAAVAPDKEITMVNFDAKSEEVFVDRIRVPLLKDSDKYFDLVFPSRLIDIRYILDGNHQLNQTTGEAYPKRFLLPPSGTHYLGIVPPVSGKNDYSFDASLMGDYRVTSFGFVYLGTGSNTNIVSEGFGIHVTFSDGTKKVYGTDQVKGGGGVKEENTFYAVKAPAGHYITNCLITTQERAWGAVDSFGFILEKPDILTLKPDFEKLTFSSFCDQNMENITEDIMLPTVTAGVCTVDWTAKMTDNTLSDVIATDETDIANLGKINVPDIPEKSNVRLQAAMTYGALTYIRNFDLYVPSKLEIDYKKISIPEKTKENKITLPNVGSEYGSSITWKSLDTSLIDDNGNVTRPDGRLDKYCVLQVTLTNPSGTLVEEFGVTVEGTGRDTTSDGGTGSTTGIVASGGDGGGAAKKPPVPVEIKPPVEEAAPTVFDDVPEEHWAYESIMALNEKGIINGLNEEMFNPEGIITREQYLAMLVRAFDFTDNNASAEFSDVEKGSWYFDAVSVAQSLGICGGYEDGSFGIGKEITREEMAVMAYRSALLAKLSVEATDENIAWKDSGEISHFAYDAVAALNNAGIIKGISEEKFSPKTTTTRAQAAVIVQRLLSVQRGEL